MPEALPPDVAGVLELLLADGDPALRAQVPHLRLNGRCACGCGTAYFDLDTAGLRPAPCGPGRAVAAEAPIHTEDGDCAGEVLVFTEDGYLSWLEVCSWSDGTQLTLATAHESLRRGRP
ncbi:hypothetical protein ACIPW5_12870 [Streptomyces sp. NPDC090077]|uniref:hypothetical protein n=1 Tax=Streptomyces sp. NPDC090077 TaxID=3365938 RepID=UPI0038125371